MRGYRLDSLASTRTSTQAASTTLGSGANGTITITCDTAGTAGNLFSARAVLAGDIDTAMSAAISSGAITVTLGTTHTGTADATLNTATLVAAAIDALAGVTATASGTGATAIPVTAAHNFTGGRDVMSQADFAKYASLPDRYLRELEQGGNCEPGEAQHLADCLSVSLATLGAVAL